MSETLDFDPDALREKYRHERDRRLRPEANDQYVEITADFRHYIDDPHVDPGFTRKPLTDAVDVVIVGGGFGGLLAAAIEFSVHTGLGPTTFTKRCRPKVFSHPSDRKGQPIRD
jgi:hypothetical protein